MLTGKILYAGSLGGHTPQIRGVGEFVQYLITGHLNLKDRLMKPSDFLPNDGAPSTQTEVKAQVHQTLDPEVITILSSDEEERVVSNPRSRYTTGIACIEEIYDNPETVLIEDVGSDNSDRWSIPSPSPDYHPEQVECTQICTQDQHREQSTWKKDTLLTHSINTNVSEDFQWGETSLEMP